MEKFTNCFTKFLLSVDHVGCFLIGQVKRLLDLFSDLGFGNIHWFEHGDRLFNDVWPEIP